MPIAFVALLRYIHTSRGFLYVTIENAEHSSQTGGSGTPPSSPPYLPHWRRSQRLLLCSQIFTMDPQHSP